MFSRDANKRQVVFNFSCLLLLLVYTIFFYQDLKQFIFNPLWTTDDALQQIAPFNAILYPGLFANDLINTVMLGYLPPLHYGLSYLFTVLTGDPMMMGHWLTLMQITIPLIFIFLILKRKTSWGVACLGLLWFLHTRTIVQRLNGGLPRGWACAILTSVLYFTFKRNHKAVLLMLFFGCLLNPTATIISAAAYGLFLLGGVFRAETRAEFLKPLLVLFLLSPVYLITVYNIAKRPPEVGQMVTFAEASSMPEFQKPGGRFPFLPHDSRAQEFRFYGYQPFLQRLYNPDRELYNFANLLSQKYFNTEIAKESWPFGIIRETCLPLVIIVLLFLMLKAWREGKSALPWELLSYVIATLCVYELSRIFAFKLYVPNRHLQNPMAMFWILAFLIAIYTALSGWIRKSAFAVLIIFVVITSGSGLYGEANYNYSLYKKGKAFEWLRNNTALDSVIAGHPTHLDAVMLFAARQAFATTETAHPFYPKYFSEIKRRLSISLKAHYAKDLKSFIEELGDEKIDYFLFSKMRFYPAALKQEDYFEPLNNMVKELTSRDPQEYAYKELPQRVDSENYPFLVFRDQQSAIVDVKKLKNYLNNHE